MKVPRKGPERLRLRTLEARAAAQREARAVADGVAETVALSRARGQAVAAPPTKGRRQPYRRQTGLDWLAAKGRIGAEAQAAGERYGQAWRRVAMAPAIPSSLAVTSGGGGGGAPLDQVLAHGEATERARVRLAMFRARLAHQPDLVAACDLVCGRELTPREAVDAERDAARIEAVLKVALDLLAGAG